ncbi:MAG: response regulator [Deltaproteobacteria bacterium]|nr:response regulator [Deltaproteobacteria bacterium]
MPQTDYPAVSKKPTAPTNKAPEVLIIEKEKLLRLMLAKLLQVSGYKVYTCGDSHRGLELIGKRSLDLVITDLVMKGASGMDVLRAARRYQPRAKVIIITDTPSSHTLLEARLEGAYAYLRKPFQLKHFLSILRDAVEHTKLLQGYQYQAGDGRGTRNTDHCEPF